MITNELLIKSILDDDLYKFTMGAVVYHNFPETVVSYKFTNRGGTKFPIGFKGELVNQLNLLAKLKMTEQERDYLLNKTPMRSTYIDYLFNYTYNPNEVNITQYGGDLNIEIYGYWHRTILWEVKLMAIISELYFKLTGQIMSKDWIDRIDNTASKLSEAGCQWSDFGTRRRYSYAVQDMVVNRMSNVCGFSGTSNPYLAMKYDVNVNGTFAHESVMALAGLYGVNHANKLWLNAWAEYYNGKLGIALTDTYTTDVFLETFDGYYARLYDGVRHDSNDPFVWGKKILEHYEKLNINPITKRLVFSDGLDADKYVKIHKYFVNKAIPFGGIGTFLTNNVGAQPLNMVIKLNYIDTKSGKKYVVKLSDDWGKNTGNVEETIAVKKTLGIEI